jgi:ABC-type dipeptide/oligopeptide/nickel transport system permease component
MGAYLVRRFVQTILVAVRPVKLLFFLLRVLGDPLSLMLPIEPTPEMVECSRAAYDLADPPYFGTFESWRGSRW